MKKKSFDYRWQQQQKAKIEYKKVKKIKEEAKKLPVNASEELDYINKLLSGEDVGDFGPEEVEETKNSSFWSLNPQKKVMVSSLKSYMDYLDFINGKGYYR